MKISGWPGPILHLNSVDSTQTLARRMAEEGAPEWSLIVADRQTAGRGRMSHQWSSQPGGLYFSIILHPDISPTRLAHLSLATADTLAKALTKTTGLQTAVKPPNDIMARHSPRTHPSAQKGEGGWRKVCGILAEASGGSDHVDWVVVGIGVNINNRIPQGLKKASSLSQLAGKLLDREEILGTALHRLIKTYKSLSKSHA